MPQLSKLTSSSNFLFALWWLTIAVVLVGGDYTWQLRKTNRALATQVKSYQDTAARAANPLLNLEPLRDTDHVLGDRKAPILLIEYSDLECPYCKEYHSSIKSVAQSNNQVAWVYRQYPLSFHENAEKEAEASECIAEQGGDTSFWKFVDAVFARTTSGGTGFPTENLKPLAAEIGANADTFQTCLDSGKFADRISHDEQTGTDVGIHGTPGTVVYRQSDKKAILIPGAVSADSLQKTIQELQ